MSPKIAGNKENLEDLRIIDAKNPQETEVEGHNVVARLELSIIRNLERATSALLLLNLDQKLVS